MTTITILHQRVILILHSVLLLGTCVEPEGDQSEASCDNDSSSSLDLLCSAFPNHSREELQDLLMVCNGDVDSVFGMLTD